MFSLSSPFARRAECFIRAESSYVIAVLCPLTWSSGMEGRVSADRSVLFVRGAPHIHFHALFLSAQAHTNSCSFPRRASAYQFLLLVFGTAQAHADPISFVFGAAQAHADAVLPLSSGIHSRTHQPRWTWAEAQSVLVLTGTNDKMRCCCELRRLLGFPLNRAGSALLPWSSPRLTTWAADVLLPFLSPA